MLFCIEKFKPGGSERDALFSVNFLRSFEAAFEEGKSTLNKRVLTKHLFFCITM